MKKRKIILSIMLIIIIILSYCPLSFSTIIDNDNGKMYYYKKSSGFDVKGYVNGTLQSTTFMDGGYYPMLKVDSNEAKSLYFSDYGQKVDGVEWDIDCSFINNGRYVKITYTLTNKENTSKNISLGTYADVQIAGNDRATIERFENNKGLKLYDKEENIQFSFYGKSVAGTTDIDNLWIGTYPQHRDNYFNNNTINKIEEKDSAFTFSWTNRTLAVGATNTYSVIIGIGEVSNAPKIELDENQGSCFSQDDVVIKGTISDADNNSNATLYYSIDGGTDNNLEEQSLINSKLDFSLDLTSQNLSLGNHTIKLYAIDESGNPSEIVEKSIFITNLKVPTLTMSEEWSKEDVTFTITDTLNNTDEVLKYQYKIDNGEWQDIELNVEMLALDKTGTAAVMARVIGKQTDEYSSIVSKTAKVDKDGPVINISEKDGKVTIDATDEQSGVNSIKYVFTTSKDLEDKEEPLEYEEPIEYNGTEKSDLYLHIISTDKLGNEATDVKEYKAPVAAKIETEEEFIDEKPTYELKDEENQADNNYTYQVKINDGEWQEVNINTEYTVEEAREGRNTIKTRTIDSLGRISEEKEIEIAYQQKDNTVATMKLPNTGITAIIGAIIIIVGINVGLGFYKYNRYKDIK